MPSFDPDSIRRQESRLILLNLAVLAGIAVSHALFAPVLGSPGPLFFVILLLRFTMQTGELAWLQTSALSAPRRTLLAYGRANVWINIGFAFLLSRVSGVEDSHYVVLMVIPVVAAAFRYGTAGVSAAVVAAATLTFLEVWFYYAEHGQTRKMEYFEAASVMLLYAVVAIVVVLLVRQVRQEQAQVAANLAELQATRDRLMEEEKLSAIGRLASAIAHEVRNPVAMIASAAELRLSGSGGIPREDLDAIILEESRRLERLTSDFLSYAKHREIERAPVELAHLAGYAADLIGPHAGEREVAVDMEADGGTVSVDAFQLHQALMNVLMNAVAATPPHGRISIRADISKSDLTLTVGNQGEAIPPEVVEHLFEPFFTTRHSGTGLGLSIARSIAAAHGGTLALSDNTTGRVCFTLTVPNCVVAAEEEAACPAS